jgi:hypothetical protein
MFNALFCLVQVRLEHFQLNPDATGVAAKQKLWIGKSKSMGIGAQYHRVGWVLQQLGPGIGHALFRKQIGQGLGVFHRRLLWAKKKASLGSLLPEGAVLAPVFT